MSEPDVETCYRCYRCGRAVSPYHDPFCGWQCEDDDAREQALANMPKGEDHA